MLVEALAIGGLGLAAALGLGVAARVFYVEVDPLAAEIEEALPGANCGGCGFAGCSSAAIAMAGGKAPANICVGGGPEIGEDIAAILGVSVVETEPEVAEVGCRYPVQRADVKYDYSGVNDCRAAVLLAGGPKECPIGCLGLGSCVSACPFGALTIGEDGLPQVDEFLCTGCGTCVRTCPQGIMHLTSLTNRILGEYTTGDCTAPCQRTCPAGINVPAHIQATAMGDNEAALRIIKERNPLPLICGRICPHPCEAACRRNLADEPVAINPLKRFVADLERDSGQRIELFKAPATGNKIAVIGGGVEGLTASAFLARLGHSPVIFEAQTALGGLLRRVIPTSRLPREVLDWEIEGILEMGVEAHTGQRLGQETNLTGLFDQDYQTVLIATGGWDSLLLAGPNPEAATALPGVYLMFPLGLKLATGQKIDLGGQVVLVGGGREALAMAQALKERGAGKVTLLWRRSQQQVGISGEEVASLRADGISPRFSVKVTALGGEKDGVSWLSYQGSAPGKGRPLEAKIDVDAVVAASGRLPELVIARELPQAEDGQEPPANIPLKWHTVVPYRAGAGAGPGLFDLDAPVSDYRAAVEAIGAGRRAAATVHKLLTGEVPSAPANMLDEGTEVLDVNRLVHLQDVKARQPMPEADPVARLDLEQEIELGLSAEAAKIEAQRCLNCGLICYYRTQYH